MNSRECAVAVDLSPAVLIEPRYAGETLLAAWPWLRGEIDFLLPTAGGVLLRGFQVESIDVFQQFAAAFGHPLLAYEFASTPRAAVSSGIYTSTEYPPHQHIPLHNEQAYTREWPMKIWFHCVTAPLAGGETPVADSRAIYRRMPASIRERFADGVVYVRNFGHFDVPWQKVFNTSAPLEVERYCARARIVCEWLDDGGLRTRQLCQAVERHPATGEFVWFNQAHLFHISNLQTEIRELLVDLLGIENVPRNAYFADGGRIEDQLLDDVRAILAEQTHSFPWREGDVMMLDNMLTAHGRTPFEGPRKVVVAMAEHHDNYARF